MVGTGRQRDYWVLGKDPFLDLAGGNNGACFIIINCRGETGKDQPDKKQKDNKDYTTKKI